MGYTMDGFRKDVKSAMTSSVTNTVYRVRKAWNDASSQIGAYVNLNNAIKTCDKAGSGYYVFDANGSVVHPVASSYKVKVTADGLNI